jgi:hypothetical protein
VDFHHQVLRHAWRTMVARLRGNDRDFFVMYSLINPLREKTMGGNFTTIGVCCLNKK